MVIHAAYDHLFDNGPLVLSDVALLLRTTSVDWPLFWRMAGEAGWTPGCMLVFAMVERRYGVQPIEYPRDAARPSDLIVDAATAISLQRLSTRASAGIHRSLDEEDSVSGKLGMGFRRLRPRRAALAAYTGFPSDTRWLWLAYPAWLVGKSVQWATALSNTAFHRHVRLVSRVNAWLLQ